MKRFFKYLKLQLIRMIRFYPKPLIFTLILGLCFGVLGAFAVGLDSDREELEKINIGVVGDMTNSYLDLGLTALQNFDSSRFSVEILTLEENEAKEMLRSGKISCYVYLSDDFASAAVHGRYVPAILVTDSASPGFSTAIVKEVSKMVESLVFESQNGVFGAQNYIGERSGDDAAYWAIQDLALDYVSVLLARDSVFETSVQGGAGGLSLAGHYVCALGVFLMLIWGVVFAPVLVSRDMSHEMLLASRGTGAACQILCRFLAYFITLWLTVLLVCLGAAATSYAGIFDFGLRLSVAGDFILLAARLAPAAAAVTAMHLFLYECSSGMVGGIILQFVAALSLGYVSGCFYPTSFFPVILQKAAALLPSGAAVSYAESCISTGGTSSALYILFGYTALFVLLASVIRRLKIRGWRA